MSDIDFSFLDEYDGMTDDLRNALQADISRQVAPLAGSTLRKSERAATAERDKYRDALLEKQFKDAGIPGKPSAYRGLDAIDPTDPQSVTSWGTEMGLITPPAPPEPDPQVNADLQAQQRITAATAGAGEVDPQATFHEELNNTQSEEEVMALLARTGRTEIRVQP